MNRLILVGGTMGVGKTAASGGLCELREHCNTFEPWVYTSQQMDESPRRESR